MEEHEHLRFICLFTMKCRGWISSPHLSETLRCTFRNITAFIARFMHCFASLLIHKFSCTTNNLQFCKWLCLENKGLTLLCYRSASIAKTFSARMAIWQNLLTVFQTTFQFCSFHAGPGASLHWVWLLPLIPVSSGLCSRWMELQMLVKMDRGMITTDMSIDVTLNN